MLKQTWRCVVGRLIRATPKNVFHLDELYSHARTVALVISTNENVKAKMRQVCCEFEREGKLYRVSRGVYRKCGGYPTSFGGGSQ